MFKTTSIAALLALASTHGYSQISTQLANQQLTINAKQKINQGKINLDSLLKNQSNDLIIEFEVNNRPQNLAQSREHLAQIKSTVQSRLNNNTGVQVLRDYNNLPFKFYRVSDRGALVKLLNDPQVKAVYPNRQLSLNRSQTLNFIGQPTAQASRFTGQGTTVAVIDTGLNYRHSDFGSCSTLGSASCKVADAVEIARADSSLDDSGHGTNVSSIVAGVAPDAKLVGLDVFTRDWLGRMSASDQDIMSAINWVINHSAKHNIKAANMSLGWEGQRYNSTCSGALQTSFDDLRNAGVVPIVASGNDGFTNGISYPACLRGAVSVGAVYDGNLGSVSYKNCSDRSTFSDKVTCFSNSGNLLTLLAPGANVTAGGYTQSGTSQAAPHVAGAISVLRAPNALPNESIDNIVNRLRNTGTLVTDSRNNLRTPRLDLAAAVRDLTANNTTPTPPPTTTQPPVQQPAPTPVTPTPPRQQTCYNLFFVTYCV